MPRGLWGRGSRSALETVIGLLLVGSIAVGCSSGTSWYVDVSTGSDTRDGRSEATSFRTIGKATTVALPGDLVAIKGGAQPYENDWIVPARSGTAAARIRYQGYGAQLPRITRNDVSASPSARQCILLDRVDYVDVSGVICDGRGSGAGEDYRRTGFAQYVVISGGQHDTISQCQFVGAISGFPTANPDVWNRSPGIEIQSVTSAGLRPASFNEISANVMTPSTRVPNIGVMLWEYSSNNLIDGNTVQLPTGALMKSHAAMQVYSSYNRIRGNLLSNTGWTTLAIERPFAPSVELAQYNVVEDNRITGTPVDGNAIQVQSQHNIFRRNRIDGNGGKAIAIGRGSGEPPAASAEQARYLNDNRIYHNVFYRNGPTTGLADGVVAIQINCDASAFGNTQGNAIVNNIFFRNRLTAPSPQTQISIDMGFSAIPASCVATDPKSVNGPNGTVVANNSVRLDSSSSVGSSLLYVKEVSGPNQSVAAAQTRYPTLFRGNVELDPGFVSPDAASPDFRLQAASPVIDQGGFLATVVAPVGVAPYSTVQLSDVGSFSDGDSVTGGDRIQFASSSTVRTVLWIDHARNTISFDPPLSTVVVGDGVALPWTGARPDLGAFER